MLVVVVLRWGLGCWRPAGRRHASRHASLHASLHDKGSRLDWRVID
jgi:hypothetical protein